MYIPVPDDTIKVEIPDEWWKFSEMDTFSPVGTFYLYSPNDGVKIVPVAEVEPPQRNVGVTPLKKSRLVPILMAFVSKVNAVPPIDVSASAAGSRYKYRVANGYHRYYASIAAGYRDIPVVIKETHAL